jgi:hypothetical protein
MAGYFTRIHRSLPAPRHPAPLGHSLELELQSDRQAAERQVIIEVSTQGGKTLTDLIEIFRFVQQAFGERGFASSSLISSRASASCFSSSAMRALPLSSLVMSVAPLAGERPTIPRGRPDAAGTAPRTGRVLLSALHRAVAAGAGHSTAVRWA